MIFGTKNTEKIQHKHLVRCRILSVFNISKIIKIGYFWQSYCSRWWHICAAGTNSSRSGGLHWSRCHHECSRHCSHQSMFCSTPSNAQCASLADTYHLVDTSACICGDKGGLLQVSSLGYFRKTVTTAAVCHQRRRSSHVLCKEVGAHNSSSPWTTLAENSGENSVPVMCSRVSLPYRHGCLIGTAALSARHRHTLLRPFTQLPT